MGAASLTYDNRHNFEVQRGKLTGFPTYIIKNLKHRFNPIDSGSASRETIP
ncbi:hypothetical protein YPPY13_4548 [Yersinia pestis PY-13]|uniref:Uncharacterized protein n=1 Tax=Yersinia pestis PY-08 TaxID=992134 RepID=A0AB72ZDT7_YERPE|nr:hypothetical protein YPPY03_4600 [Yersinia pestis PY-03]EIR01031.1 hypothetical protein YPPY06_4568 [Yersinia pestis PY-06]EIR12208.1 hypothetical protein YPPY07_4433 [Yersinia pestis PY-07]EIR12308.1 hypothetical protein YPPY08_4594 [Yersinia pestis PY-08]EIR40853.1 hypothetical protein YPPY13_4548 [Yersinia pestis PY-13]EIR59535.1 hypothetical protein YPPY25_4553 [Yersinia pestis PY-25]EIR69665.1 hypothetical protein YPPY29_4360 [Yersinia pestis PY-29]EIR70925.1 hypothetical protein YPP